MTDASIQKYLNDLNAGKKTGHIIKTPLCSNVDLAKIWIRLPAISNTVVAGEKSYSAYLIKDSPGKYIGAVIDMVDDLHWFITKTARKQGYLSEALREIVLPHIFKLRNEQKITIDKGDIGSENYASSLGVAKRLGFKVVSDTQATELILKKSDFKNGVLGDRELPGFSSDRLFELKAHLQFLSKSLSYIQDEVELSLGETRFIKKAEKLSKEISELKETLHDEWAEWSNRINQHKSK
ncbi:GNAT family protein [Chitinophaga caseinilytica]|uniref:GNAT family protein n=1 Tax=Chitinophaga caseinilytica TaxID=2267521 RepID=A0ABZ2ZAS0_9BACT